MPGDHSTLAAQVDAVMRVTLATSGATHAQLTRVLDGALVPCAHAYGVREIVVTTSAAIEQEALVLAVARHGRPVTIHASRDSARLPASSDMPLHSPRSAYCFPLLYDQRPIAVFYLKHDALDKAFSRSTRARLDAIAPQMAHLLAHANLNSPQPDIAECQRAHADRITAIGELVASIIHELSQPLSAIDASSGAALRWLERDRPNLDEAIVSLESVQSCAVRVKAIIERLRTLNRQANIPFEHFDVHAAIREVVQRSHPCIDRFGAAVTFAGMTNGHPILGNRAQIQQVVENLIANALEAMNDINGRARIIDITSRPDDDAVTISIADSGPGVTAACRDELFRPFFTTKPQGMGMGLSICKRIVEAHGGTIWTENVSPNGARFSFDLGHARD